MNYEQKSNALLELLSQLADDTEYSKKDRGREIQILSQIYSEGFRHSYAKISTKVQAILEDDIDKGECLSQNLQMLKKSIEKLTYNKSISMEICNKVRKLCDHVNLEIGRYNLIINKIETRISNLQDKQNTGGIGSNAEELNKRITEMENKVSGVVNKAYEATKELEKVDGKLERNSMSSITTLTIFSAVILAFTGSITFTSGVFSGIRFILKKVSLYHQMNEGIEMNQLVIGKYISLKRKQKNMTQEQLAEKLGVSNKTISKWETGKCMPDYSIIKNLCDELEITVAELFDGETSGEKSVRVYDKEQFLNLLRRTQELEKQKNTLYGVVLIVMGIAMQALSYAVGGSDMKDFISGVLLGMSIAVMLIGVYVVGKSLSGK